MTQETSKRINILRTILIVFVIFSHNNSSSIQNTTFSYAIKMFASEMTMRVAVPLFFFISGYLLFRKKETYSDLIRKKCKTLLIPYLLWNGIVMGMFLFGQNFPLTARFFADADNQITNYSLFQWLDAFLGLNYHGYPIAYQFWFVRDLMILTLLYPVWDWLLDHVPQITFAVMIFVWLMQWRVIFWDGEATLFFLLGGYIVKHDMNFMKIDKMRIRYLTLIYLPCVFLELGLVMNEKPFIILHKLMVMLGCILWLRLSKWIVNRNGLYNKIEPFVGYAFFVYAFHEPMLTLLRKAWAALIVTETTGIQMVQYFGLVALVIVISLCVAWCVNWMSPTLYGVLTGGRITGRRTKDAEQKREGKE